MQLAELTSLQSQEGLDHNFAMSTADASTIETKTERTNKSGPCIAQKRFHEPDQFQDFKQRDTTSLPGQVSYFGSTHHWSYELLTGVLQRGSNRTFRARQGWSLVRQHCIPFSCYGSHCVSAFEAMDVSIFSKAKRRS
jgi:hypothetical protein